MKLYDSKPMHPLGHGFAKEINAGIPTVFKLLEAATCLVNVAVAQHLLSPKPNGFFPRKPWKAALPSVAIAADQVVDSLCLLYNDGISIDPEKANLRYAVTEIRGDWKWQKVPSSTFSV